MKTPTDYFDVAVRNTFAKTSKIPCLASSPSFRAPTDNENNNDGMDCSFSRSPLGDITTETVQFVSDPNTTDGNSGTFYAAKALAELENLRKLKLNDSINERVRKLAVYEEELQSRMNANLLLTREEINIKHRLSWKISESCISDDDLTTSQKFSILLKRYSDQKLKEDNSASNEQPTVFDNHNQNKPIVRKSEIVKMRTDYATIHERMMKDLETCKSCPKLFLLANAEFKKMQEFTVGLKSILLKAEIGISDGDIETGRLILHWLSLLTDNIKIKIEQINEEENQAEARKTSEEKTDSVTAVNEEGISEDNGNLDLCDFVCQESLEIFSKLDDNYMKVSKQVDEFIKNTSSKGFIRNLKIAINTPVNALSSLSAEHVLDKFRKISDLLRGRFSFPTTEVSDSTRALYFPFLIDFLCKKFISQGENLLVPTKPEDAFVLASIIVALWIDFPDFGPVLLTYFMKRCPYTIPAYWPQYKGQSETDFYVSRGYQYKQDGTIEDQNSFLKRMTGIFMLYVAVMVSIPRRNQQHPHGLRYAWTWLAATINLDPRPDITAALLYVFLDMAGHKLSLYYRNQFWKIMQLISTEYMIKIEKVTSDDFRGPVCRLKEFIAKVIQDGHFVEPKGILPANYW